MEYQAVFGIDGGVSPGFGVKYPDYIEKTENILADNSEEAMGKAIERARYFSQEHLSNPETGYTTVKLLSLRDNDGRLLDQVDLNNNPNINFEKRQAIIKCSMLEHVLSLSKSI
ncbi:MAG: hypothetical protein AABW90_01785 [Nanoarchaeota archaeon]